MYLQYRSKIQSIQFCTAFLYITQICQLSLLHVKLLIEAFKKFYWLIFLRKRGRKKRERERDTKQEKEREKERETSTYCSTRPCPHWLILVCALTRNQTCNRGILGWHSNQLSYPTRTNLILMTWYYAEFFC